MKNLNLALLLFLGVTLSISSCKKDDTTDDNNNNTPTNQTCYFSKVDYGDYYMMATYNTSDQLTKIQEFDSTGVAEDYYSQFTYSNGKLATMENYDMGSMDMKMEFYYGTGTHPDSLIMFSDNGGGVMERQAAYALSFTGDDLTKVELVVTYLGIPVVFQKTEYTYANGNVTMQKDYEFDFTTLSMALSGSTEYTYDTKKNPYRNIGLNYMVLLDAMFGSTNNALTVTYKDETGTIDQGNSMINTYEYTSNNYPSKIVKAAADNSYTETEMYSYNCK